MRRTDLACESARIAGGKGVRRVSRRIGGVDITDIRVPSGAERRNGRYIILEGDPAGEALPALLRRAIDQLVPGNGVILAAGLGNPDVTHDSLGALTIRRMIPGSGARYALSAVETDVSVRTGIETVKLVRGVAREIGAACVIAVDSLSCGTPSRICRTVQLTDTGITPGSGTAEPRRELSERTVGIPVISVGVPTAVSVAALTGQREHKPLLAVPADEDIQVKLWSECIANALNSIIKVV